jgi:hypothetical protein
MPTERDMAAVVEGVLTVVVLGARPMVTEKLVGQVVVIIFLLLGLLLVIGLTFEEAQEEKAEGWEGDMVEKTQNGKLVQ